MIIWEINGFDAMLPYASNLIDNQSVIIEKIYLNFHLK